MKKNNVKIFLLLLTIIMIAFTIYKIATSYALFYSQLYGTATLNLGRWNVSVNATDISNGITQEFIIDDLNIIQNTATRAGKFAPGMTGSFEIVIDTENTDVSVRYDLTIDTVNLQNTQITIESVEETEVDNTLIQTSPNTYTGIIRLGENSSNTINIIFEWTNDEENNQQDTELGTSNNLNIQIPITLTATQYLNETITQI
ncbi:MAG: hypothetical protein Q4G09_02445 [Clostridia bacterium]|nr:hypothetical protein [Clostridia bacterium]